jgi:hypothetical protein
VANDAALAKTYPNSIQLDSNLTTSGFTVYAKTSKDEIQTILGSSYESVVASTENLRKLREVPCFRGLGKE